MPQCLVSVAEMSMESSRPAGENIAQPQDSGGGISESAVYVRDACKSFGVGKRRATVLRNLEMNVKKGTM